MKHQERVVTMARATGLVDGGGSEEPCERILQLDGFLAMAYVLHRMPPIA